MIFLTGDILALSDSIRWGMSSTDIMADWDVFYSNMEGYGFWGNMIPSYVWSGEDACYEEPIPF